MAKNLSEKYSSLNLQMDKIINDANSEISNLRNKVSSKYPGSLLVPYSANKCCRYADRTG